MKPMGILEVGTWGEARVAQTPSAPYHTLLHQPGQNQSSLFLGCLSPWSNTIGKLIFPQQFQRNSQNPVSLGSLFRSFLMNLFAELEWILSATWTVDCKSPLLSQEGQEMHNQLQEKQILYFKLPWYWLHLYWNSGYVHLRVTFTSLAWLS